MASFPILELSKINYRLPPPLTPHKQLIAPTHPPSPVEPPQEYFAALKSASYLQQAVAQVEAEGRDAGVVSKRGEGGDPVWVWAGKGLGRAVSRQPN